MEDCIFCKIVKGEIPSEKIMEDENHVAFLSITPVYDGLTVIATKKHYDSYIYKSMTDEEISLLYVFAKKVALRLDEKLGSERCMQVLEGMEVNHAHVKLFPKYKGVYNPIVENEIPVGIDKLKVVSEKINNKI